MSAQLKNVVHFLAVNPGQTVTAAHGLHLANGRLVKPDFVIPSDGNFVFVSADDTNVTYRNDGVAIADCDVLCEFWHSFERAFGAVSVQSLSPAPFAPGGGGGGSDAAVIKSISAGTNIATSQEVVFSNANGVSFGAATNGSVVTASVDAIKTFFAHLGVTATGPSISFQDGNGVTFGLTGNTLTASVQTVGGTATGVAISAGSEVATTGAVVFADSNGMTFGMNASTVTATYQAIRTISAAGGSVTNGQLSFVNSNSVSFGINAGSLTASYQAIKTISASGGSVTNGQVSFANSNNVSFGMNASTMTASVYKPGLQQLAGYTASGGETQLTVTFAPAAAATAYSVMQFNNGVSMIAGWDMPAGSRSVSQFIAIPTASMQAGDQVGFYLFST